MKRRTMVSAAAAALLYAVLWIGWTQGWSWLTAMDTWLLDVCARPAIGNPTWVRSWEVFCDVFGPLVFRTIGLVVIVVLLNRRYLRAALFLLLTVELSALVLVVAKLLAQRPRPASAMVHAAGTSFPSGHALGVSLSVLALLTVTLPLVSPQWRRVLVVLGAVIVVAIGIGRVILNVHNPSDVLAGWALGYLYYVVFYAIMKPLPLTQIKARGETPATPGTAH
ncbi:MAG: phosphatase PAP2 family protein [Mycobacterium sp.]|nr:phosphatase PAP2 family protein [Mycobacterium sp.]